jgi:hypothetical protein
LSPLLTGCSSRSPSPERTAAVVRIAMRPRFPYILPWKRIKH